jgi:hypothetical protein
MAMEQQAIERRKKQETNMVAQNPGGATSENASYLLSEKVVWKKHRRTVTNGISSTPGFRPSVSSKSLGLTTTERKSFSALQKVNLLLNLTRMRPQQFARKSLALRPPPHSGICG